MDHPQSNQHLGRTEQQHQRFSWQPPQPTPPEEEAAAFYNTPQPSQQQHPEQHHQRGFSYVQTPIEHRAPNTSDQPPLPQSPHTPIDPRPQSFFNPHHATVTQPQYQPQYTQPTYDNFPRTPISPVQSVHPSQTHPALQSPVSPVHEPAHTQPNHTQPNHVRQRSALSPINTSIAAYSAPPVPQSAYSHRSQASPLPIKSPMTPASGVLPPKRDPEHAVPMSPSSRKSHAMEPYSPHGFGATGHAVFSPDAATGPNGLDFHLHQPGQIAHPNMDLSVKGTEHEWKHSLCECGDVGTCVTGLFCPCILYGRTAYRMNQKAEKKDPTDMLAYSSTNGHCGLMAMACGAWCLFPLIQRTRLRHLYKLTGSLFGDIGKACCCCCCVAIQNEREVRDREESARRWAGPASTEVYKAPPQMAYVSQS